MTKIPTTGSAYRRLREQCGTQQEVADQLCVDRGTISRRESDTLVITNEAAFALLYLYMLKNENSIYIAGADGVPIAATFGIYSDHSRPVTHAVVVCACPVIFNSDRGRNAALNQILATKLSGVRLDFIEFICIPDLASRNPTGKRFEILADLGPIRKKRSFLTRKDPVYSSELVAGDTRVFTDFERGDILEPKDTIEAAKKAGLL